MFNDDGGFFGDAGGYGQGGQGGTGTTPKAGGGKGDQGKRAQNLLPVNTYQIRNSTESGVQIGGVNFFLVTLVGRVVEIDQTSLKVNYTIEDDRGTISAVHWNEQDGDSNKPPVVENVYCRVYGSIRSQEDKKFIMVFNIKPIKTLNELTSHRLEVAVVAKKLELAPSKLEGMEVSNDVGMNGGGLGNSLMDMGCNKVPMSNMQRQVFAVIKRFTDPGVHVNDINNYLTEKISQAQINKICEDLMNEGHIYSSVDEFHFLCTES